MFRAKGVQETRNAQEAMMMVDIDEQEVSNPERIWEVDTAHAYIHK